MYLLTILTPIWCWSRGVLLPSDALTSIKLGARSSPKHNNILLLYSYCLVYIFSDDDTEELEVQGELICLIWKANGLLCSEFLLLLVYPALLQQSQKIYLAFILNIGDPWWWSRRKTPKPRPRPRPRPVPPVPRPRRKWLRCLERTGFLKVGSEQQNITFTDTINLYKSSDRYDLRSSVIVGLRSKIGYPKKGSKCFWPPRIIIFLVFKQNGQVNF